MNGRPPLIPLPILFTGALANTGSDWVNVNGQARLSGYVSSDKESLAGFPILEWTDKPAGGVVKRAKGLAQDPGDASGRFVYPIDVRNLSRFVRLVLSWPANTDVAVELNAEPQSGGPPT